MGAVGGGDMFQANTCYTSNLDILGLYFSHKIEHMLHIWVSVLQEKYMYRRGHTNRSPMARVRLT